MFILYQIILILVVFPLLPVLLAGVLITGWQRQWIFQRLGWLPELPAKDHRKRIWFHASSVGEVFAARILIEELHKRNLDADVVVTTMTIHGCQSARQTLAPDTTCLLAPLDLPGIVDSVIARINPDLYVVMETELWPLILHKMRKKGVAVLLANGRMSARSWTTYQKKKGFFQPILAAFDQITAISETDLLRFESLGVARDKITVSGNCKYDRRITDEERSRLQNYQQLLDTQGQEVLVCGSTHEGEEELLLPVLRRLQDERSLLCVIVPRHLNRLAKICQLIDTHGLQYDLFSALKSGEKRASNLLVVDSYGDLMVMYGLARYIFCGGSLVAQSGHNVMEAALWGRPVFFGPSMADFQNAAELLKVGGGGFMLGDAEELYQRISELSQDPESYTRACQCAQTVANSQQGAAARQADMILSHLTKK